MIVSLRRTLLKKILGLGLQISPDALEYLLSLDSPGTIVDSMTAKIGDVLVLSREHIEQYAGGQRKEVPSPVKPVHHTPVESTPTDAHPVTTIPGQWSIQVLKDPSRAKVGSEGVVEDFVALFKDRYRRIKKMYMKRVDTKGAVSPGEAKKTVSKARQRKALIRKGMKAEREPSKIVLGIVKSKRVSKSRNVVITLEGIEGADDAITCVIPTAQRRADRPALLDKGNSLILDEVVCISGTVDQFGRIIADDVLFPDIPTTRPSGRAKEDIYAAFISDMHCGSHEFLEDDFDSFIDWLSGRDVDSSDKEIVSLVNYLFIAGDLVDGIGVYPGQENNLLITDIHEQYKFLADKLRRLPERIKIICIPGNHDASRQALPKPAIPEKFAKPLYELGERVLMLGDCSQICVDGVSVLLTHGDSLDDLVTNIPGASYTAPAFPMKNLLIKRHLAPLYGNKTELAPLHRDWLVIDDPPDVVHFGHAHHNAVDNYRGVQIINSGTFQGQTDFMRKQGVVPTPGIVTLLNLRTGSPSIHTFSDLSAVT